MRRKADVMSSVSDSDNVGATDRVVDDILRRVQRIAVVGLSDNPLRASHQVAATVQASGRDIVPVNPGVDEVLGVPAVDSLADIDGPVDLVNVFRRPAHLVDIARDAAAIGAPALWNQVGLTSDMARTIAEQAGMDYVEDRCLKVEILRRTR